LNRYGGLATPHTPQGVAFYLDQAYKAQTIGANSAAVAMYRGALERLLFEQGYQSGMLATKVERFIRNIQARSAPQWALELETEILIVLQVLGKGVIHPNDGDVQKQAALDNDLLEKVQGTFKMLCFLIYEVYQQKQKMLAELHSPNLRVMP
jgi:hypothetical protein